MAFFPEELGLPYGNQQHDDFDQPSVSIWDPEIQAKRSAWSLTYRAELPGVKKEHLSVHVAHNKGHISLSGRSVLPEVHRDGTKF